MKTITEKPSALFIERLRDMTERNDHGRAYLEMDKDKEQIIEAAFFALPNDHRIRDAFVNALRLAGVDLVYYSKANGDKVTALRVWIKEPTP